MSATTEHPSTRRRLFDRRADVPVTPVAEQAALTGATPVVDADPLAETQTSRLERNLSQVVNHILWSGTIELDANGVWSSETSTQHFRMPYAAVHVRNVSNNLVVFTNQPTADRAPTKGAGVHLVSGRTAPLIGIVGQLATIYGEAGERLSLTFYSRPQAPSAGEA